MNTAHRTRIASLIVLATGILWGIYWLPVRRLDAAGLPGAWGTALITLAAVFCLAPVVLARRDTLMRADRWAVLSLALGGGAFALYSIGLLYGRVAIVILLFFLTPVWSTLIARYVLGWRSDWLRVLAIASGLAGLLVMLGAGGQMPMPRGLGEWLGLLAGIFWAVGATGIRTRPELPPAEAAFVFAGGAALTSLLLSPVLEPWPAAIQMVPVLGIAALSGAIWWGLSMAALMWATARLEPARVGILLMTEVLVGAGSAAWLVRETLAPVEVIGGALVLCAAVLEIWPGRANKAG